MAYSRQRLAWLTIWLQRRRRARAALHSAPLVTPSAPVFTSNGFEWDVTQAGWADTFFNWTFDHGGLPVASIEIWLGFDSSGVIYELVATVPSTERTYRHNRATEYEDFLHYQLRYVDGGTVGPFSNELVLLVER